jgi:hypothetical protein
MLREEHRLRVFENRVLRRTFGHKTIELTQGWRKIQNEELHKFTKSTMSFRTCTNNKITHIYPSIYVFLLQQTM